MGKVTNWRHPQVCFHSEPEHYTNARIWMQTRNWSLIAVISRGIFPFREHLNKQISRRCGQTFESNSHDS